MFRPSGGVSLTSPASARRALTSVPSLVKSTYDPRNRRKHGTAWRCRRSEERGAASTLGRGRPDDATRPSGRRNATTRRRERVRPARSARGPVAHGGRRAPARCDGRLPTVADAPATPMAASEIAFASRSRPSGKLWGIGLNYADHAADLNEDRPTEPASFMKPATAATGPSGPIRLPPRELTNRVTAEAELASLSVRRVPTFDRASCGRRHRRVRSRHRHDRRGHLERNPRFLTRSKSFDSFLVFGSMDRHDRQVDSLDELSVKTVVNENVAAENRIDNMMTPPRELVSFHSEVMTLEPGDIISTGTPGAKHHRAGRSRQSRGRDSRHVAPNVVG